MIIILILINNINLANSCANCFDSCIFYSEEKKEDIRLKYCIRSCNVEVVYKYRKPYF